MSSAEEHVRNPVEDRALLRLTTARPAELASAIGPDLRPGYSAGLIAPDADGPSGDTDGPPAAVGGPFPDDADGAALELAAAIAAEFRAAPGPGRAADRLLSPAFDPGVEREPRRGPGGRGGPHGRTIVGGPVDGRAGGSLIDHGGGLAGGFVSGPAGGLGGGTGGELVGGPAARGHPVRRTDSGGGTASSPVRLAAVPDPDRPATPAVPIDAALWLEIGALIPEVARRRRQPGRRRRDDRAVLEGILHVLATGIGWRELPQDLGCGSGVTCWRRLREWVDGGTWTVVEPPLRAALGPACGVDWDRPWAGTGRSPAAVARRGADGSGTPPARAAQDPGATPHAVARRLAWAGPSLL